MTIVLGVIGAVVGSYFGNWQLGWAIGTTIGGLIDASGKRIEGSKLTDLHYSGSQYGTPIPKVWGKAKIGGNIIWVQNWYNGQVVPSGTVDAIHLVEHEDDQSQGGGGSGGGGGATVATYWYSASYQVQVCEAGTFKTDGTFVYRNPVIKRIWADDLILYDVDNPSNNKTTIRFYYGGETQVPDTLIQNSEGSGNVNANRGTVTFVVQDHDLRNNGNRIPNIQVEVWTDAVTVADIMYDISGEVGLDSTLVNYSAATALVTGYYAANRQTVQETADPLLSFYSTDIAEIDGKVTLIPRGGASVATIPITDMGAVLAGSSEFGGRINFSRGVRTELPGKFEITYYNAANVFTQDVQSDINEDSDYLNPSTVQIPMCLLPTEARQYAARLLDTAYLEQEPITIKVGPEYCYLVPSDPVTITGTQNDWTFSLRYRITTISQDADLMLQIDLVRDELYVLDQFVSGSPGSGGGGTGTPLSPVPVSFAAWSGIELQDADKAYAGFYVAATWIAKGNGGSVMYSPDGGVTWVNGGFISSRTPWGVASSTLADGSGAGVYDTSHTVNVEIVKDGVNSLISRTQDDVKSGQNCFLIGNEIGGFVNATATGATTYTLSNLYRGFRGSPYTGHGANELFVALNSNILRVNVNSSYVGSTFQVKVLAPGQVLSDVTAVNVTIAARTPSDLESYVNSLRSVKSKNTFFAGPASGADASPTWRVIDHDDIDWSGSVHGYGTTSARPAAASSNSGYLYFNTDTSTIQRSNGTTWIDMPITASGGATIGQIINNGFLLMGA